MTLLTTGRLGLLSLAAICITGCATTKHDPPAAAKPASTEEASSTDSGDESGNGFSALDMLSQASSQSTLRLRLGDIMEVRLGGVPVEEINQVTGTYVVDTQGFVNMPHIGRIHAAGLTQEDLQAAIENEYRAKGVYTNPTITVSVPMASRFVNVGGEVRLPQRVSYTPDLTLVAALSAAGGLTEYASQSRIRVVRGADVVVIDLRKVRKDPTLDIPLEPGDSIEVMRSFF